MKRLDCSRKDSFQKGSNRIVFIGKNFVYKVGRGVRGLRANRQEYQNYLIYPKYVAYTQILFGGLILKQEKLTDLKTFSLLSDLSNLNIREKILFTIVCNNRLQIGKSQNGIYKRFDVEQIKFELNPTSYYSNEYIIKKENSLLNKQ